MTWILLPAIVFTVFIAGCDLALPTKLELPQWNTTLNIPLINQTYPVSDLANSDSLIQTSGDTMFIRFGDTLGTVTITDENFFIPIGTDPITMNEELPGIDFPSVIQDIGPVTVPLPDNIVVPDPADPLSGDLVILKQVWDLIADTLKVNDESDIPVDESAKSQINEYFSAYSIVIADSSYFRTTIVNNTPGLIDTIQQALLVTRPDGSFYFLVNHFAENIPPFSTYDTTTELKDKRIEGLDIKLINKTILDTAEDHLPVPPDSVLGLIYGSAIALNVSEIHGIMRSRSLVESSSGMALPSDNSTKIISGVLADTDPDTNRVDMTFDNSFPFDVNLRIRFNNFFTLADTALVVDTVLSGRTNIPLNLSGYTIRSETDGAVMDEISYETLVSIPESSDTVIIPVDGSPFGQFDADIQIHDMKFSSLTGIFNLEMPCPPTSIQIPQGITAIGIAEPQMTLSLTNELNLSIGLGLEMISRKLDDELTMSINPMLNYPQVGNDSATTEIILNQNGMSVYWDGILQEDQTYSEYPSLVDLINLGPDNFIVRPTASIRGEGSLVAGKKIYGNYDVLALFKIMPDTQIFLAMSYTEIAPWDTNTAESIRNTAVQGILTANIGGQFPLAGHLTLLMSDSTIFPENRQTKNLERAGVDSVVNDTLYLSSGDTTWVDTIFRIPLPKPILDPVSGAVIALSDTTFLSIMDYLAITRLCEHRKHYVIPKIVLYESDQVVWLRKSDFITIQAFMGFTLKSEGLFGSSDTTGTK